MLELTRASRYKLGEQQALQQLRAESTDPYLDECEKEIKRLTIGGCNFNIAVGCCSPNYGTCDGAYCMDVIVEDGLGYERID
jgi:hypothetical protein